MNSDRLSTGHAGLDVWSLLLVVALAAMSTVFGAFAYRAFTEAASEENVRWTITAGLAASSALSLLVLSRRKPIWAGTLGAAAMLVVAGRVIQTDIGSPGKEFIVGWAFAVLALCATCGDWQSVIRSTHARTSIDIDTELLNAVRERLAVDDPDAAVVAGLRTALKSDVHSDPVSAGTPRRR